MIFFNHYAIVPDIHKYCAPQKAKRNAYLCTKSKRVLAPKFYIFYLILCSYDYNMHVKGLLPAYLCLVALSKLEQYLQFQIFRLHHA